MSIVASLCPGPHLLTDIYVSGSTAVLPSPNTGLPLLSHIQTAAVKGFLQQKLIRLSTYTFHHIFPIPPPLLSTYVLTGSTGLPLWPPPYTAVHLGLLAALDLLFSNYGGNIVGAWTIQQL